MMPRTTSQLSFFLCLSLICCFQAAGLPAVSDENLPVEPEWSFDKDIIVPEARTADIGSESMGASLVQVSSSFNPAKAAALMFPHKKQQLKKQKQLLKKKRVARLKKKKALLRKKNKAKMIALAQIEASKIKDTLGWIKAHNKMRCMHGVPPVIWDDTMAKSAQHWADHMAWTGNLQHSPDPYSLPTSNGGPAGENVAQGQRTAHEVVSDWYSEVGNCGAFPGCNKNNKGTVSHFTALAWKEVTKIGCGHTVASNWKGRYFTCRYGTDGKKGRSGLPNMQGQYEANVFAQVGKSKVEC